MTHSHPEAPAQQTPAPGAPRPLLGPRPLPLHLAIQASTYMTSFAALKLLRNDSFPWRAELKRNVEALEKQLASVDPEDFSQAVVAEVLCRQKTFVDGVLAYRRAERAPCLAQPPAVWQDGSSRLLDYGALVPAARDGAPLLVIPSLINRAYILDLSEHRSFLRALAQAGFRPFLLDWGAPDETERLFSLTDIIAGRLEDALTAIRDLTARPVGLIGHCMGGLLALALAQRRAAHVTAMALLATPWDFHADGTATARMLRAMRPQIEALIDATGVLPVDALQTLFASLAPYATLEKFQRFAALKPGSARAREFIALEDWLNDGIHLAGPIARECLFDWYVDNQTAQNRWTVAGERIEPARIEVPALVVVPEQDYIVPPASALALTETLAQAEPLRVAAGHIGMTAGRQFRSLLLKPLTRWLKQQTPD